MDYLKNLSVDELAAWYRRLGNVWSSLVPSIKQPLAGKFILTWLDNDQVDKVYEFDAPEHLRSLPAVITELNFHRDVFLTNKKARYYPRPDRWAGLLPRIQGFTRISKVEHAG